MSAIEYWQSYKLFGCMHSCANNTDSIPLLSDSMNYWSEFLVHFVYICLVWCEWVCFFSIMSPHVLSLQSLNVKSRTKNRLAKSRHTYHIHSLHNQSIEMLGILAVSRFDSRSMLTNAKVFHSQTFRFTSILHCVHQLVTAWENILSNIFIDYLCMEHIKKFHAPMIHNTFLAALP